MRSNLDAILGLKVLTIRGERSFSCGGRRSTAKHGFLPCYILFNDKKTYIQFTTQDYGTYHDCDGRARVIDVRNDAHIWATIFKNKEEYPPADRDI